MISWIINESTVPHSKFQTAAIALFLVLPGFLAWIAKRDFNVFMFVRHIIRVEKIAVFAMGFNMVHGGVGIVEQHIEIGSGRRVNGNPNAQTELQFVLVDMERFTHFLKDFFHNGGNTVLTGDLR